jgi:hypothetical protein
MRIPAELAGSVGTVALFAVPGYALTELFGTLRRLPWPRRAAYGYLLGLVAVAGGLYLLSHAFSVPLRAPAVWSCAVVPALGGLVRGVARRRQDRARLQVDLDGPPRRAADAIAAAPPDDGAQALEAAAAAEITRHPASAAGPTAERRGAGAAGQPAGSGGDAAGGTAAPRAVGRDPECGVAQQPAKLAHQRPFAGLAVWLPQRLRAWPKHLGGPLPMVAVVLAALICLGVLAEAASNPIHDWDGRMTWSAQARYVRAAGTVDAEALQNPRWYISHPQYPLLLPVAQVAALEAFGAGPDSHLQRALYAAFLPVLLLLVYDGARRAAGPTAAALVALAAAAIPFFAYGEGGAFSTYSDLPLACFYGAALLLLLGPRPTLEGGIAAGMMLAGAVLCKNEGVLLAALALAVGWRWGGQAHGTGSGNRLAREDVPAAGSPSATWREEARQRSSGAGRREMARRTSWHGVLARFAAAALPALLALALLASWRHGIPNREDEDYPLLIQAGHLWPGVLTRVKVFAPIMLRQMFRFHHWAGFWWMAPVVLLAGRRALRHPLNRRRLLAAAGPLAIGWAACSIYPNPYFLASVTWERMLLQGAVPMLIVLAAALAEVLRHVRRRRGSGAPAAPDELQRRIAAR